MDKKIAIVSIAIFFFVLLFLFLTAKKEKFKLPINFSNFTALPDFEKTLFETEEIAIVMNATDLPSERARYVYMCGAGLAGSWGKEGKNISKLYNYVIDGENCILGIPGANLTQMKNTSECIMEYAQVPYFYIAYGPSFSIFTKTTATVFIDESWEGECSYYFQTSS